MGGKLVRDPKYPDILTHTTSKGATIDVRKENIQDYFKALDTIQLGQKIDVGNITIKRKDGFFRSDHLEISSPYAKYTEIETKDLTSELTPLQEEINKIMSARGEKK